MLTLPRPIKNSIIPRNRAPGDVRDSIIRTLSVRLEGLSVAQITRAINESVGETPASSVRSYLNLNTSTHFVRSERGVYQVRTELFEDSSSRFFEQAGRKLQTTFQYGRAVLVHSDCFDWMRARPEKSMNAIVTEPPDASDDQGRVSVEVAILRKCRRVLGVRRQHVREQARHDRRSQHIVQTLQSL